MPIEIRLQARAIALITALATGLLAGCAVPASPTAPAPTAQAEPPVPQQSERLPSPAPTIAAPNTSANRSATAAATTAALDQADRLRTLNAAELAAEITRLSNGAATPLGQVELALALMQGQQASDAPRIQQLLQAVLGDPSAEARGLHPLVRLLVAQQGQLRRLEEQADRQNQSLRESQRKIDQLNERLEALRAIERSMPRRPAR